MDELKEVLSRVNEISDEIVISGADLKLFLREVIDYCEFELNANKRKYELATRLTKYNHQKEMESLKTGG